MWRFSIVPPFLPLLSVLRVSILPVLYDSELFPLAKSYRYGFENQLQSGERLSVCHVNIEPIGVFPTTDLRVGWVSRHQPQHQFPMGTIR